MPDDQPRFSLLDRLSDLWGSDSRLADEAEDEDRSRRNRGTIPIAEVADRQRVTLFGSLLSMTFPPASAPAVLVATLYDGTGSIELRWPGRTHIPGLSVGVHIEVEGTAGFQGDQLVIVNPLYRVVTAESA
ncbi:DNA-binding protein [Actinomyces sp. B33]|uniref:DNA-binding protein n=1 Tax=Actinomyces sp. B33 TaxID=2942131 RepID=UPI0023403A62|nr:DNA-binding protein [Actinomyces sp. B33]MDC4233189.1 DNA-binding protein [Actinomyces sp. B33]